MQAYVLPKVFAPGLGFVDRRGRSRSLVAVGWRGSRRCGSPAVHRHHSIVDWLDPWGGAVGIHRMVGGRGLGFLLPILYIPFS